MRSLILYVADDYPGKCVEEKTHAVITSGLEAARLGYDPEREVFSNEFVDQANKFRVRAATAMRGINQGIWEVLIEGEDLDIELYEKALGRLE